MITLNKALILMKKINQSKDYSSYFDNGKMIIESNIITLKGDDKNGN